MRRVITGFNATNAAQGQRLGFTYTEMTDSGKTTSDNNKGSMTVLSEEAQSHIDWLKNSSMTGLRNRENKRGSTERR